LAPGQIVVVDIEGEGEEAKFVFRGEDKPVTVPDAPPVDLAGSVEGGAPAAEEA
ncbi:MAG: ATPase domain protein, partial [Frankiales bacterium]|nr:ATPase domain protein [Frankiales bacterium]